MSSIKIIAVVGIILSFLAIANNANADVPIRPQRPVKGFANVEDVQKYLQQLKEFVDSATIRRYGKRNSVKSLDTHQIDETDSEDNQPIYKEYPQPSVQFQRRFYPEWMKQSYSRTQKTRY